jgi:hypothetical protein
MSNSGDILSRLEDLKGYVYNELDQLIKENQGLNNVKKDFELESRLQKFKPSKHRKAYRIENNFKKKCYAR